MIGPVILIQPGGAGIEKQPIENDCACADKDRLYQPMQMEAENDCACAPASILETGLTAAGALYQKVAPVFEQALGSGYHVLMSPTAPDGPCVVNDAALARWQHFSKPVPLTSMLDQQLYNQQLVLPCEGKMVLQRIPAEKLTVWLQVTDACNLACRYCYVKKSSASLPVEMGRAALRQVFETARERGFKQVKLKYSGGEALLFFERVQQLHEAAREFSQASGMGLETVLLSNGTLVEPTHVDWLVRTGTRLMLSVDGVGELHDRQRPFVARAGSGTFAQIARVVDEFLLPRGVSPHLSVTITGQNSTGIAEILRWGLARELPLHLNLYRRPSLSDHAPELDLEAQAIIAGMREAYQVLEAGMLAGSIPEFSLVNSLLDHCQAEAHSLPCGAGQSYLVVTADGQFAPCHGLQAHTAGFPTPAEVLAEGSAALNNLSVDEKIGCKDCLFRYRCAGGCPIETHRVTQRWGTASPHCAIYRALLPDVLRLEGLRLLRMNQASIQKQLVNL